MDCFRNRQIDWNGILWGFFKLSFTGVDGILNHVDEEDGISGISRCTGDRPIDEFSIECRKINLPV